MHWFWRAVIAVVVSATVGFLCTMSGMIMIPSPYMDIDIRYLILGGFAFCALSSATLAVIIQTWLKASPNDGETRCRKCRYILRGITEPRCPECGERI